VEGPALALELDQSGKAAQGTDGAKAHPVVIDDLVREALALGREEDIAGGQITMVRARLVHPANESTQLSAMPIAIGDDAIMEVPNRSAVGDPGTGKPPSAILAFDRCVDGRSAQA